MENNVEYSELIKKAFVEKYLSKTKKTWKELKDGQTEKVEYSNKVTRPVRNTKMDKCVADIIANIDSYREHPKELKKTLYKYSFPIGNYKGYELSKIPLNTLKWYLSQDWFALSYPVLYELIQDNISGLIEELQKDVIKSF